MTQPTLVSLKWVLWIHTSWLIVHLENDAQRHFHTSLPAYIWTHKTSVIKHTHTCIDFQHSMLGSLCSKCIRLATHLLLLRRSRDCEKRRSGESGSRGRKHWHFYLFIEFHLCDGRSASALIFSSQIIPVKNLMHTHSHPEIDILRPVHDMMNVCHENAGP